MSGTGWIGFDFDGTLCSSRGEPIARTCEKLRDIRRAGVEVRIVTARVNSQMTLRHRYEHTKFVEAWCQQVFGETFVVTAEKDYEMILLYDDRAVAVQTDTGEMKGWTDEIEVDVPKRDKICIYCGEDKPLFGGSPFCETCYNTEVDLSKE